MNCSVLFCILGLVFINITLGLEESKDLDIAPVSNTDIRTRNSREAIGRKGKKTAGKPKGRKNKKQKKQKKGSTPKKNQRKANKRGKKDSKGKNNKKRKANKRGKKDSKGKKNKQRKANKRGKIDSKGKKNKQRKANKIGKNDSKGKKNKQKKANKREKKDSKGKQNKQRKANKRGKNDSKGKNSKQTKTNKSGKKRISKKLRNRQENCELKTLVATAFDVYKQADDGASWAFFIYKNLDIMDNKAKKSLTAFTPTAEIIENITSNATVCPNGSGQDLTDLQEALKLLSNCTVSVSKYCSTAEFDNLNRTFLESCSDQLKSIRNKITRCLKDPTCKCLEEIPTPPAQCLEEANEDNFQKVKDQRKMCIIPSGATGSFGDCMSKLKAAPGLMTACTNIPTSNSDCPTPPTTTTMKTTTGTKTTTTTTTPSVTTSTTTPSVTTSTTTKSVTTSTITTSTATPSVITSSTTPSVITSSTTPSVITSSTTPSVITSSTTPSVITSSTTPSGYCPAGWSVYKSKCYKIFNEKLRWDQAQTVCQGVQANLVTIESSDVNIFVEGMVTTSKVEYPWIGGYLVSSSKKEFAWIDGSAFAYQNWDLGQPIYNGNEGCVEIVNGKWHDFPCSFKRAFVCMKA